MSLTLKESSIERSVPKLRRRQFISTAMLAGAGAGATLARDVHASGDPDLNPTAAELLPKPADSLAHYTDLYLSRIELAILRASFVAVGNLVCELRVKYDKLLKETIELERLLSGTKDHASGSQIKEMTALGRTSVLQLKELAQAGVPVANSPSSMVTLSFVSLKNSVIDWEQEGPITLSGTAVALLRSIIRQIKDLEPLVKNLTEESALLTTGDNELKKRMKAIRGQLTSAVKKLVDADTLKFPVPLPPPPADSLTIDQKVVPLTGGQATIDTLTASATKLIRDAIGALAELNTFSTPVNPAPQPNTSVPVTEPSCLSVNTPASPEPLPQDLTKNLQELLRLVIDWIEQGGLLAPAQQPCAKPTTSSFLKASFEPSTPLFGSGIWFGIRRVLHWYLPQDSRGRAAYCCLHIGPVLFNPNEAQRYNKIYEILPDLIPQSDIDLFNSANQRVREEVAKQFSQIRP